MLRVDVLLSYISFKKKPPASWSTDNNGPRCGTCDTCINQKSYADDLERDFANGGGARIILYVLSILNDKQGISNIEKILKGQEIEQYRYRRGCCNTDPEQIQKRIVEMKSNLKTYKKHVAVSYFTKDLLPALQEQGYAQSRTQQTTYGGGDRTKAWSSYELTSKGRGAIFAENDTTPIILPVLESIREYEKEQKRKMTESLLALQNAGIDTAQIPQEEIEEGDGIIIRSFRTWHNYIELLRKNQNDTNDNLNRIDQLEDLRLRIDAWRMDNAGKLRISPSDALPDHL